MSENSDPLLHIWLISDGGEGLPFMVDVERMLHLVSQRQGISLTAAFQPRSTPQATERFLALPGGADAALRQEVGVHRAQRVPHDSQSGRVVTSAVGVEVLARGVTPTVGRPDAPVVKTYNYVQRRVTRHATRQVLPLDAVLSGEA